MGKLWPTGKDIPTIVDGNIVQLGVGYFLCMRLHGEWSIRRLNYLHNSTKATVCTAMYQSHNNWICVYSHGTEKYPILAIWNNLYEFLQDVGVQVLDVPF